MKADGSQTMGTAQTTPETISPATRAVIDRCSVALFAIAWLGAAAHLMPPLFDLALTATPLDATTAGSRLSLLAVGFAAVLVGYLLADLIAGTAHWIADRHFAPTTPLLGPLLIVPFRAHHDDAESISRHDFFEVSGNNALATTPVALGLLALPTPGSLGSAFVAVCGLSLTAALVATNQFHGWAHARRPPAWVRPLHGAGLILTPKRHAKHHREAHDRAYCVTSGWLNPLLDGTRFFERLDNLIDRVESRRHERRTR